MNDHDPNEETIASLLHTIALIREAAGCEGVMLGDLPAFVKGLRDQREEARREVCMKLSRYQDQRDYPFGLPNEQTILRNAMRFAEEFGWNCFDAPQANATDVPVQNGGE